MCGEDGVTYGNACMARAACQPNATPGACAEAAVECVPNAELMCTMDYSPVCADGATYSNACAARRECKLDYTDGACETVTTLGASASTPPPLAGGAQAVSLPDDEVSKLAAFALAALATHCATANSMPCATVLGAQSARVTSASTQVVAGTLYHIEASADDTSISLTIFKQPWTSTLQLVEAKVRAALLGDEPADALSEPLALSYADYEAVEAGNSNSLSGLLVGGAPALAADGSKASTFGGHYTGTDTEMSPRAQALQSAPGPRVSATRDLGGLTAVCIVAAAVALAISLLHRRSTRYRATQLGEGVENVDALDESGSSPWAKQSTMA